jgi:hypothetical protein
MLDGLPEPCAAQVARTVPRGLGSSNAPWLPDRLVEGVQESSATRGLHPAHVLSAEAQAFKRACSKFRLGRCEPRGSCVYWVNHLQPQVVAPRSY